MHSVTRLARFLRGLCRKTKARASVDARGSVKRSHVLAPALLALGPDVARKRGSAAVHEGHVQRRVAQEVVAAAGNAVRFAGAQERPVGFELLRGRPGGEAEVHRLVVGLIADVFARRLAREQDRRRRADACISMWYVTKTTSPSLLVSDRMVMLPCRVTH